MSAPLFDPDEIPVDERIDYLASLRERTIPFVRPEAQSGIDSGDDLVATGTDGLRTGP